MAVLGFSRIPPDVWIAAAVAIGVLLIALDSFMPIFVGTYVMLCAYVVIRTFTDD